MKNKLRILLIMAKRPLAGNTKTRLSPPYTLDEAAELYTQFLLDAIELARSLPDVAPAIAYSPDNEETLAWFGEFAPSCLLIPQRGETLGDRLDYVLSESLKTEIIGQAVAMCSDSPALPPELVMQGFERLDDPEVDVTLGPCDDGGYYLIGWKRPYPRMVKEVTMSTDRVTADTLAIAREDGIRVAVLPEYFDVDTAEDLDRVRDVLADVDAHGQHTKRFLETVSSTG
ncbi:MAG: rSAM/selenodomain-associated transferase 1 [Candidatus Promineifilaceae bacterium]|jgi:rSAM/selenodomain-associated transferase 1